jgi:hypothetical protein
VVACEPETYAFSVALTFCSDVSVADWIVHCDVPWAQLAVFGPASFAAYARLRFLPDPSYEGQTENDADRDGAPNAVEQWQALFNVLAAHTQAPGCCYFAVWEGWGLGESLSGQPKFSIPSGVTVPARSYFLYRGCLSDAWDWGSTEFSSQLQEPAFIWPADRRWCVANDVDPHWASIGGEAHLITELVADPRLDAVTADPSVKQPAYR